VRKGTGEVICTAHGMGARHDFHLLKRSRTRFHGETVVLADSGYLGLEQLHRRTQLPKKRARNDGLNKDDKMRNWALSRARALCENVIGALKRFRILAEKYRNRRRRFGLRFALIAGVHNANLGVGK